ncbi:MAG TPA: dihydrolipoyl dehydrogenase [Planctomycetota bacterium]|nr:dihydrolipoyl dehydrogenase [Planctomycetota bacterium]HRR82312.1 dihydrolipoyl dehydrogenase [Planctomycetota bacterium]HRT97428.1 dihydrolipoyl dehydrogenase [Planctomycetota bacterium]
MAKYDVVVIGSGPGGYVAALRAAQLGRKTCVVERDAVGGVCLNRGCIPTKALAHAAEVCSLARHGAEFGILAENVSVDFAKVQANKDAVVKRLTGGVGFLLKRAHVDVVAGTGRLKGRKAVAVTLNAGGEETLEADKIIVATGSEPARPKAIPFDGERIVTSDEALRLSRLPESVFILGGGYIGCEFASIFAQLGAQVTVVEMLDRLLPTLDAEVAAEITKALKRQKVKVLVGTRMEGIQSGASGVKATLSNGAALEADLALVCTGRRLLSADLGLEEAGAKVENGAIAIDEHCETSVAGLYAIGDVTGKLLLAHVASAQGIVAAEHAAGRNARMDYRCVPAAVFTNPEVGTVGMTEAEAAAAGRRVRAAKFPFQALGRAVAMGETAGFAKIVADEATGQVLGVHLVGPHASDVVAEGALAVALEATVKELAHGIHAHPTLPEALLEAARAWLGQGIHA